MTADVVFTHAADEPAYSPRAAAAAGCVRRICSVLYALLLRLRANIR